VQIPASRADTVGLNRFRRQVIAKVCAAGLLCGSGGALAQTIYKHVDATGGTTFTDRPAAMIGVPRETLPGEERDLGSSLLIPSSARRDVAHALASNSVMSSMYAATIDFNEATRRLRQARDSRQEGMEPRAGDWADSAGASTMNRRYARRQQKLEREVMAAERRSHETSVVRSALLRHALSGSDAKTDPSKLAQP
jgi:hypothetical protein